jgi:hypothetical protein
MRIDPALGFVLLQGFGRVARLPRTNWRNIRGLDTADDRQPLVLLRTYPLLGLRRPSCADVTGLSGCIHLHGAVVTRPGVAGPSAFCEADASPIHRN